MALLDAYGRPIRTQTLTKRLTTHFDVTTSFGLPETVARALA